MTDPAIQAKGLQKSFKTTEVLKGVDFEVRHGEIFALLGSNGAGKTTIIRILTTLLVPDGGTASVCGFDVQREGARAREQISLTGQFTAVDPILTGRENLRLIAKLRHLSGINEKTAALLEEFGLADAADRPANTYSGGMARRLDLAMSMLGTPLVIFLDEPTTGLDPQARNAMWAIIERLAQSGATIFLTTQYLEEAERLANNIAILHDGRIVIEGSAEELKNQLPSGRIELRLADADQNSMALELLIPWNGALDDESQVISLITDSSVTAMTGVLDTLAKAGISVAEFSQKTPTLEDVFLSIVGSKTEKGAS